MVFKVHPTIHKYTYTLFGTKCNHNHLQPNSTTNLHWTRGITLNTWKRRRTTTWTWMNPDCNWPLNQPPIFYRSYIVCYSLIPRPLPDFISQPWRKIGRRPGQDGKWWTWLVHSICAWRSTVHARMILYGLWTDAISAVKYLFLDPKIAFSIYRSKET